MAKLLALANALALLVTLAFNYLSNTGIFNNETMASVSDRYANLFTPAGFTFSVWGIIYTGLLCFVIYISIQVFRNGQQKELTEIGWWFTLSCIANCTWIFAWLYDFIGLSVCIMIFLLFCLVMIIIKTNMERRNDPLIKYVCIWWPFAIYSGWISVALVANTAAWLTKMDWDGAFLQPNIWTVIMILVATILAIVITWQRNMREFAITVAWGLFGVAMANREVHALIWYTALAGVTIILLNALIHVIKNRRRLPWTN